MLGIVTLQRANAQQTPTASQSGAGAAVENNGEDFTRPTNLFQLRYLYQAAPGSGSVPGTLRTVTTDATELRSDLKFDIAPQWTLALRGTCALSPRTRSPLAIRRANSSTASVTRTLRRR